MPRFQPKNTEDLDWGGFPPVSSEALNWKPDPDSIAMPGSIPDPRFNRGPYEVSRKAAYKKENRSYSIPADVAASTTPSSSSPAFRGVSDWPVPEVRASGLPRDFISADGLPANPVVSGRTNVTSPHDSATLSTPSKIRDHAPAKGTMETLPITPQHPGNFKVPSVARLSTQSTSSSVSTTMAKAHTNALTAKFIPPHLRKKFQRTDRGQQSRLDPAAKSYFPKETAKATSAIVKGEVNETDTCEDAELAWKLATVELGVNNAEEGLQLQKKILDDYSVKPSSPTATASSSDTVATNSQDEGHGRYLMIRLVMMMEHDLDLNRRVTKRELMAMSEDELNRYSQKAASAHQNWWKAEQRLVNHDNANGPE